MTYCIVIIEEENWWFHNFNVTHGNKHVKFSEQQKSILEKVSKNGLENVR